MKIKKLAALFLTCAIAATATSVLAACNKKDDEKEKENGGTVTQDTRIWYAVGNSEKKGDLKENNWTPNTIVDALKFTKKADENVFTVEFSIYAGDGFKFIYKTSETEEWTDELWPRQIGIHHFDSVTGEGKDAVLKNGEDVVFTTRDGIDANNLYCAKGQDGRYKFTLTTFPDDSSKEPVLKFEKVSSIEVTHDMYLYGDINDYGFGGKIDAYPMDEVISGESVKWTKSIEIKQEDLVRDADGALLEVDRNGNVVGDAVGKYAAVQVYNKVVKDGKHATYYYDNTDYKTITYDPQDATVYPEGTGTTFNLLEAGKYTITYDQTTNEVVITSKTHDMYLIGDWYKGTEENSPNYGWGYENGYRAYPLTESQDGTYWSGYITVTNNAEMKVYNEIDNQYYTAAECNGGNIGLTAGTWAVKYTVEDNKVEYEKCEYYVVGTFVDSQGNKANFGDMKAGVNPVLVATATEGVYSVDVEVENVRNVDGYSWMPDNGIFALKAVYGSILLGAKDWYNPVAEQNNGDNIVLKEEGTYTVTLTLTTDGEGKVSGACSAQKK